MPCVRLRAVSSTIRRSPCAQVYKASPRRCSMLSGFAPRPGRGAGRASTSRRLPDVPVLTCRTLAEAVVLRWFTLPGPLGRAVHPRSRQPKPPLYSCPTAFEGARLLFGAIACGRESVGATGILGVPRSTAGAVPIVNDGTSQPPERAQVHQLEQEPVPPQAPNRSLPVAVSRPTCTSIPWPIIPGTDTVSSPLAEHAFRAGPPA